VQVVDLMTTDVITVSRETGIRDAARLMFRNRVSGLPVTVVRVPERTLLAMDVGPLDDAALERFAVAVEEQGIPPAGDVMFKDGVMMVPVVPGATAAAPLRVVTMPAMRAAAVELSGSSLDAIDRRIDDVYRWIEENGYRPVGPALRVLLDFEPGGYRLEVLVPVEATL